MAKSKSRKNHNKRVAKRRNKIQEERNGQRNDFKSFSKILPIIALTQSKKES